MQISSISLSWRRRCRWSAGDDSAGSGDDLLPVGSLRGRQRLELAEKRAGRLSVRPLFDVSFVPIVADDAEYSADYLALVRSSEEYVSVPLTGDVELSMRLL